jgi:hypothetical protein
VIAYLKDKEIDVRGYIGQEPHEKSSVLRMKRTSLENTRNK